MFRKVQSQVETYPEYVTTLSKSDFEKNESKVDQEISNIEKKVPLHQQIAVKVNFDNKEQTVEEFLRLLKQQKQNFVEKKSIKKEYDNFLFHNIGGKNVDVSTEEGQNQIKREIAAIDKQIQIQEETLAQIDKYVVDLLSGDLSTLNIAHTNAKFIKTAEDDMVKQADEEIEDYYNNLYQKTKGSPNFGTALEHYEENRNKLTEDIETHANVNSKPKFKKK